jgi:CTP synthase
MSGLAGAADSTEFDPNTPYPVVGADRPSGSIAKTAVSELRNENSDKGGTMRLGSQEVELEPNSLGARRSTASDRIAERHRHRYEINNNYLETAAGRACVSGWSIGRRAGGDDRTADAPMVRRLPVPPGIHLDTAFGGHPLFKAYIEAALAHHARATAADAKASVAG